MIYTPKTVEAPSLRETADGALSGRPAIRSLALPRPVARRGVWRK
jgi:hypothetical protein